MIGLSNLEQSQENKGLVHLYVGNGKGKTTAAVGLAVRALGCGHRVLFCQFLKGRPTGELGPLEQLGAEIIRPKSGNKFVFAMEPWELEQAAQQHRFWFDRVGQRIAQPGADEVQLLVLDEVVDAINAGLLELDKVLALLQNRPPGLEVVMTGRNPATQLCEVADYYTEFLCHKHPYEKGMPARKGVEF